MKEDQHHVQCVREQKEDEEEKEQKKQRREDSCSEVDLEPDSVCSTSDLLSYTFLPVQG